MSSNHRRPQAARTLVRVGLSIAMLAVLAGGTAGGLFLRAEPAPAAVLAPAAAPVQAPFVAPPVAAAPAAPTKATARPASATSHPSTTTRKAPRTTKAVPAKQPSSASDTSYRCTNRIDYSSDPRDNATINSIGAETGKCPTPIKSSASAKSAPASDPWIEGQVQWCKEGHDGVPASQC